MIANHAPPPARPTDLQQVLDANVSVHTALADKYNAVEPHFRPENQRKVRARLAEARARAPGGRLLDIGCGTGFIIHLAAQDGLFDDIHGVDITPAMMAQVRRDLGRISLHEARAESLPFPDASFDAVSAYSFLDHVLDPGRVFAEVARVLKPGGIFYGDLIPSRRYWQALTTMETGPETELSDIVRRELAMVTENAKQVQSCFGIDEAVFIAAEPGKAEGGIEPLEFDRLLALAGFARRELQFDWFLGQGPVMHQQSFDAAATIDAYLRRVAPLADHLYKYFHLMAVR